MQAAANNAKFAPFCMKFCDRQIFEGLFRLYMPAGFKEKNVNKNTYIIAYTAYVYYRWQLDPLIAVKDTLNEPFGFQLSTDRLFLFVNMMFH